MGIEVHQLRKAIELYNSSLPEGLSYEYEFVAGKPQIRINEKPVGLTTEQENDLILGFYSLFEENKQITNKE